mmetsp:Transcript_37769/g.85191  ORF Transcript_37769/g.85191 Transcript_37769/m.85191 type:complete len:225 (+) Transcript_37769:143-817(+)
MPRASQRCASTSLVMASKPVPSTPSSFRIRRGSMGSPCLAPLTFRSTSLPGLPGAIRWRTSAIPPFLFHTEGSARMETRAVRFRSNCAATSEVSSQGTASRSTTAVGACPASCIFTAVSRATAPPALWPTRTRLEQQSPSQEAWSAACRTFLSWADRTDLSMKTSFRLPPLVSEVRSTARALAPREAIRWAWCARAARPPAKPCRKSTPAVGPTSTTLLGSYRS